MHLDEWATRWPNLPPGCLADLKMCLGLDGTYNTQHIKRPGEGASESHVTSLLRLEAAKKDIPLFRNNVGSLIDSRGIPVRFGLANESKRENDAFKSSDWIGIRPLLIGPQHMGRTIGQFVAREVKEGSWTYTGNEHGHDGQRRQWAQLEFGKFVMRYGGDFAFVAGVGTL